MKFIKGIYYALEIDIIELDWYFWKKISYLSSKGKLSERLSWSKEEKCEWNFDEVGKYHTQLKQNKFLNYFRFILKFDVSMIRDMN